PEPETNYWQTIDVYNVGSFRVPAEWYVEWDDRVLLVTDRPRDEEDYEVLLVGRISLGEEHVPGVPIRFYGLPNVDEFEWGETLWNSGLRSMGTDISLIEYFVDGERIERYFIGVSRSVRDDRGNIFTTFFSLLIWSNNVDSHTADQIARTFRVGL
ncbi:MAG: hypothetical protein LBE55_04380, partial [Clostridiales bacterium]|nr:hypothetical protein [Clostridiales bacterium]